MIDCILARTYFCLEYASLDWSLQRMRTHCDYTSYTGFMPWQIYRFLGVNALESWLNLLSHPMSPVSAKALGYVRCQTPCERMCSDCSVESLVSHPWTYLSDPYLSWSFMSSVQRQVHWFLPWPEVRKGRFAFALCLPPVARQSITYPLSFEGRASLSSDYFRLFSMHFDFDRSFRSLGALSAFSSDTGAHHPHPLHHSTPSQVPR